MIIPHIEIHSSAIQIRPSAYQSSLHFSRTSDLRSCHSASLKIKPDLTFGNQEVAKQPLHQYRTHFSERWTHWNGMPDLKNRITRVFDAE